MKLLIRRVLNLLLYLSFCFMIGSGLLLAYRLVPGRRGGQGLEMLGWSRHDWGDLHTWIAYFFMALIVVHLAMSWTWLVKCAAQGRFWRLVIGLLAGLAIIAAFLLLPVERRPAGGGKHKEPTSGSAQGLPACPDIPKGRPSDHQKMTPVWKPITVAFFVRPVPPGWRRYCRTGWTYAHLVI